MSGGQGGGPVAVGATLREALTGLLYDHVDPRSVWGGVPYWRCRGAMRMPAPRRMWITNPGVRSTPYSPQGLEHDVAPRRTGASDANPDGTDAGLGLGE